MNQSAHIDPRTLLWIKQEVAETLTAVGQALESFGEHNDGGELPACADGLDKIRGALEIVEIAGGVSLAREMHAVALALATERPRCRVIATDISPGALETATANANRLGLSHVEFRAGDWFAPVAGETLDMIVSNPPYVRANDVHWQQGDARFEPVTALVSGKDGLNAIRHLAENARNFLRPNGWLMLEHGSEQPDAVNDLLHRHGYRDIVFHRDLAGHVRVAACHR